ncbi:MAG: UDP-N-acetylmuramate:L-alanyl-gamma-D-glutamyl-meso-diaminopimelate ligase [Polaromonas sp.]|uniref:UDP-N-acetylmuramate:L-alanyl-gamma-D-glutamyl- meso-diaminopimelate ligase n=1 Tax=Polaromonas sp. TaxID=1869339 RepID=UPI0027325D43|nr:UDP-N-acetylmuramate:L-alanyl-gamma-D-glutamyl-meso-diaminopimelate ligase [Polaromonas sp.]MDP3248109.1 UDP-N-acetylmuramate:L-alanyl-gamma-D-glutamyl-meso-diaminopimelate ligase [Polaromonas sp.]
MHIHILGICGTFMGGLAALAREAGHKVTGCDTGVYPPMSDQLRALGIELIEGYGADQMAFQPDVFVVGNVVSRAHDASGKPKFPLMEAILNAGVPYTSGPQWLSGHVLHHPTHHPTGPRHVLAVAGTHGKTTTTAMLAWILECAGLQPGFLVGGVPLNFGVSARLGTGNTFVIEADEYDTAFFDKRSKFVHYRPRTAILNNLEYDHADIFPDLGAIERQFHHLVRTVPGEGQLIVNAQDLNLPRVLAMGAWSGIEWFDGEGVDARGWQATRTADGFALGYRGETLGTARTPLAGPHNRANALAAIAAARQVGVSTADALRGLESFRGIKRRLELLGTVRGVEVFDDFAHHPTAISVTIAGLRERGPGRILAVLEPRSNTMRLGGHAGGDLAMSLADADLAFVYARPDLQWDASSALAAVGARLRLHDDLTQLTTAIATETRPGDRVLVMSNGDFGGLHQRLLDALQG